MPRIKDKKQCTSLEELVRDNIHEANTFMDNINKSIYVYTIMKKGEMAGRIVVRFAKTGGIQTCVQIFDNPSAQQVIYMSPSKVRTEVKKWLRLDTVKDRDELEKVIMKRVIIFAMNDICECQESDKLLDAGDWQGLFSLVGFNVVTII